MPLQILYARAHSGKTSYILDKCKKLYDENKPLIVVVPEQSTHIYEKRLIKKLGSIQMNNFEVLSFDRISKRINDSYVETKKHLSKMAKALIVSKILKEENLDYYNQSKLLPGFCDECVNEISEFKKCLITPDNLDFVSENTKNKILSYKLKDLSKIYKKYEDIINKEFADSDDLLNILSHNLNKYKPYKSYTFLFDEFTYFNAQEINLISEIASQAENVYITLCADFDKEYETIFKSCIYCGEKLKNSCREKGIEILDDINLSASYYKTKDMCMLEKYLFTQKSFDEKITNIRIFSSENPYTEVEQLCQRILALVMKKNVRFRDISVVCSDISNYSSIISQSFKSYNIPCFIDEKVNILDHSIVSFVTNIIDVYLNSYKDEYVINFLKSPCINVSKEHLSIIDNFIKATSATKNTYLDDERWFKTLSYYSKDDILKKDALNYVRDNYILPLSIFHEKVKGKKTVKDITTSLYNYLLEISFDKTIENYIVEFKNSDNTFLSKQYEMIWQTLIEALDVLVSISGDEVVNLSTYQKYFQTVLRQQKTGIIPTSSDEVIIGDIHRSKSDMVDYRFILGATDGLFPKASPSESIISDEEKSDMALFGAEMIQDKDFKLYLDRFLIYQSLTSPDKALFISYPLSDTSFSPLKPSFMITSLKALFKSLKVENCEEDTLIYDQNHAFLTLAKSVGKLSRGEKCDDKWKNIYKFYLENEGQDKIDYIDSLIKPKDKVNILDKELMDKIYTKVMYSTVSRLQMYNSCKYSYFMRYILKLKEKDNFEIKPVDIGSLVHEVIENFFKMIKEEKRDLSSITDDYISDYVLGYLNGYIENLKEKSAEITMRELFKVSRLKEEIVFSLLSVKNHIVNSHFEPIGHEIVFDDQNIGCIELTLSNGKNLKITGKIDRADAFTNEDGTFVRVIDYKTGSKTFNFTDVFYGLDIQLLVYLNALCAKDDSYNLAGALFFKIQNPIESEKTFIDDDEVLKRQTLLSKMDGVVLDNSNVLNAFSSESVKTTNKLTSKQFKILGDYVNSILIKSAENITMGNIEIDPYQKSTFTSCDWCEYKTICNFSYDKKNAFRNLKSVSGVKGFFENAVTNDNKEDVENEMDQ